MRKLLSLAFLSIVVLSFTSCKKDDDVTPAEVTPVGPSYVGTWSTSTATTDVMKIIFTANSYEKKNYNGMSQFGGAKGTVKVEGDLMTTTQTEICIAGFSSLIFYKAGTHDFTFYGGNATPKITKFIVVGNSLTLMTDDNDDKVYGGSADRVSTVLTKQ